MAKKIWNKTGEKADVGGAAEKFSLESGKCVEDSEDTDDPTKKRKVSNDTLPCLSSSNKEEEDQATDKAIAPAPGPGANVETVKRRIPPMAPKVGNKVDVPTVTGSTKRSHNQASSSDFLEAFQLSILQDKQQRECNRELRERNRQDQLEALAQE